MPLVRMRELLLEECVISRKAISVRDCLEACMSLLSQKGPTEHIMIQLHKRGSEVELYFDNLRRKANKNAEEFQQLPIMLESKAKIESCGENSLFVLWNIPIRKVLRS